ncbi:MAG: sulfite exporter TauE/SafE family protein [Methylovulum sp.]|nr:sulfite exporter TauE/SafE family protein [Methylovulum sp.]
MKHVEFSVGQMVCTGCEDIINTAVRGLPGIVAVRANYVRQQVKVDYDDNKVTLAQILTTIETQGYPIVDKTAGIPSAFANTLWFLLLLILVGGVAFWGKSLMPGVMQQIRPHMDDAVLLGIGFLTGFHCIGMCGGFIVAYADKQANWLRQLSAHAGYALGKTLSYSVIGAGFGVLGASIAITPQMRGIAALAASVFLIVYGLKMLNVFTVLRRFTLHLPKAANQQITDALRQRRSPLVTGLLTGLLLGCGPLQAMYVMAAGTGDPVQGAKILALFSAGTLLPLLGFGAFASFLPAIVMRQLVRVSGMLVIAMGLMMANRGLAMYQVQHKAMMQAPADTDMHLPSGDQHDN